MIRRIGMNDKPQRNSALVAPLIFTVPASSFIVILNFDWFEGTKSAAVAQKTSERQKSERK
jgi:hypothetical protein